MRNCKGKRLSRLHEEEENRYRSLKRRLKVQQDLSESKAIPQAWGISKFIDGITDKIKAIKEAEEKSSDDKLAK
jgi:hypothetical protein